MKKIKKVLIILITIIILFITFSKTVLAMEYELPVDTTNVSNERNQSNNEVSSAKITEEDLKFAFQKLFEKQVDNDTKIEVKDGQIIITGKDISYTINYDLTNNPIFTCESEVHQGMSYEDFQKEVDSYYAAMICYSAVAYLKGVEYEDSIMYIMASYFESLLTNAFSASSYVIINDTSSSIEVDDTDNSENIIYASEFGEHVMEYVNATYKEKSVLKDDETNNTFEMTTEQTDVTSTSCKIKTTLTVNLNGDFAKIKGYSEKVLDDVGTKVEDSFKDSLVSISIDDDEKNEQTNEEDKNTTDENKVANLAAMPKTGKEQNPMISFAYVLIVLSVIGIGYLIITRKD